MLSAFAFKTEDLEIAAFSFPITWNAVVTIVLAHCELIKLCVTCHLCMHACTAKLNYSSIKVELGNKD